MSKSPGLGSDMCVDREEAGEQAGAISCRTLNSRPLGLYPLGPGESRKVFAEEGCNQIQVLESCLSGTVRVEMEERDGARGQCGGQANVGKQ